MKLKEHIEHELLIGKSEDLFLTRRSGTLRRAQVAGGRIVIQVLGVGSSLR
jgi:hypothetical protein